MYNCAQLFLCWFFGLNSGLSITPAPQYLLGKSVGERGRYIDHISSHMKATIFNELSFPPRLLLAWSEGEMGSRIMVKVLISGDRWLQLNMGK